MSSGNFVDDPRFDGLYLNVAQQTRGIEPLLDTVFSFLRRKTDFFAGPPGSEDGTAAAIQKVNDVLQKHAKKYQEDNAKSKPKSKPSTSKPSQNKSAPKSSKPPAAKSKKEDAAAGVVEMSADGGFDISSTSESTATTKAPKVTKDDLDTKTEVLKADKGPEPKDAEKATNNQSERKEATAAVDDKDDGPPPLGNGGTVEGKYVWTQTLGELTVNVPVPDNTRGRDLNVTIARNHLKVALRSSPKDFIINAPLTKTIVCDDSFWTVEDGNNLVINLQKLNAMEWWDSVCADDPKIDVRKIQPENSSLSDLDGETRKTVEKMMYDQRQKAKGLPTSEEESKFAAIERFKKEHPELDFSNAKIS